MVKVDYIEKIKKIADKLPLIVLQDINNRCTDWLASGGTPFDPYIKQQLRYAKNFIREDDK